MRLINCATLGFEDFIGKNVPPYVILSHTWGAYEISYKDYCDTKDLRQMTGPQAEKILMTCDIAVSKGYQYVWIDTCCIDKSSSAELTEAINSMFKWYKRAVECVVHLGDFDTDDPGAEFARCRWFTRGWTLQELIAPRHVRFYDAKWRYYRNRLDLASEISRITGIPTGILIDGYSMSKRLTIAQCMSWAAHRETTREEDMAYCLFGIFGVNLPLLYGEGPRAFLRLQEEIVKHTTELTIFAWMAKPTTELHRGIFARSVKEFAHAKSIILNSTGLSNPTTNPEFVVTNRGLRIEKKLVQPDKTHRPSWYRPSMMLMSLQCCYDDTARDTFLCIWLLPHRGLYYRICPDQLALVTSKTVYVHQRKLLYIATDIEVDENEDDDDNKNEEASNGDALTIFD